MALGPYELAAQLPACGCAKRASAQGGGAAAPALPRAPLLMGGDAGASCSQLQSQDGAGRRLLRPTALVLLPAHSPTCLILPNSLTPHPHNHHHHPPCAVPHRWV